MFNRSESALCFALILSISLPWFYTTYSQQDLPSRGFYTAQGHCGLGKIQYEITNGALRSISVSVENISVQVELDSSQEYSFDGSIVMKLPRTLIDADGKFVVFADDIMIDYQEINSTEQYRTIVIGYVQGTEKIEIIGDGLATHFACPITLNTSYSQYSSGNPVVIYGKVSRMIENQTLDINIQSVTTSGSIYQERNVPILTDGTFNQTFTLSKDDKEGQYFVYAFYGEFEAGAEFSFYLADKDRTFHPLAITSSFNDTDYTIHGRSSEGIDVRELDISEHGIGMKIEAARDGVMELSLPKNVIDGFYYVGIGREDTVQSFEFDVLTSNARHNVLRFHVPENTQSITIQGLYTVPEFGSFTMVIGATSISSAILAYRYAKRKS